MQKNTWELCVTPIISHSCGIPGMHGSGFFLSYKDDVFLVTARHCLGKLQTDWEELIQSLLISVNPLGAGEEINAATKIVFESLFIAKSESNQDDYLGDKDGDMDLAFLKVSQANALHFQSVSSRAYTFVHHPKLEEIIEENRPKERFVLIGWPTEVGGAEIDYEANGAKLSNAKLMGIYDGKGQYPHTHKLTVTDQGGIVDFNGFSGSPIFAKVPTPEPNKFHHIFIGMVICGRSDSNTLEYIHQTVIFEQLSIFIKTNRASI